ncbi:unnamed protein product [Malus baccata var. baccata]
MKLRSTVPPSISMKPKSKETKERSNNIWKHRSRTSFLTVMVSKKFNEIAEDPCIYQLINITDFETCSNPEALYMVRMRYFFQDNKEEAGLSGLRMRSLRAIK